MKIIIKGSSKEIADFVLRLQSQLKEKFQPTCGSMEKTIISGGNTNNEFCGKPI